MQISDKEMLKTDNLRTTSAQVLLFRILRWTPVIPYSGNSRKNFVIAKILYIGDYKSGQRTSSCLEELSNTLNPKILVLKFFGRRIAAYLVITDINLKVLYNQQCMYQIYYVISMCMLLLKH